MSIVFDTYSQTFYTRTKLSKKKTIIPLPYVPMYRVESRFPADSSAGVHEHDNVRASLHVSNCAFSVGSCVTQARSWARGARWRRQSGSRGSFGDSSDGAAAGGSQARSVRQTRWRCAGERHYRDTITITYNYYARITYLSTARTELQAIDRVRQRRILIIIRYLVISVRVSIFFFFFYNILAR